MSAENIEQSPEQVSFRAWADANTKIEDETARAAADAEFQERVIEQYNGAAVNFTGDYETYERVVRYDGYQGEMQRTYRPALARAALVTLVNFAYGGGNDPEITLAFEDDGSRGYTTLFKARRLELQTIQPSDLEQDPTANVPGVAAMSAVD